MKLLKVASCLVLLMSAAALNSAPQEARRPNVLFLIADDLNSASAATATRVNAEHRQARGPRRAVRRAYCQFPLCNPSRFVPDRPAPERHRRPRQPVAKNAISPHFREKLPDAVTLPQLFKNGCFAARVGKLYHYGVPVRSAPTASTTPLRGTGHQPARPRPRGHEQIFTLHPGSSAAR